MARKLAFLLCATVVVGLVSAPGVSGATFDFKITAGSNDAEEHLTAGPHAAGEMDVGSTDLELPYEDSGTPSAKDVQLVCLRYLVQVPKGVKVTQAYVEFTCDETKDGTKPVNLIVEGQLAANPAAFASTAKNLSSRAPWTNAHVAWTVENWTKSGQKSQTPDLAAIIQELINQDGWASGNALVLAFRTDPNNPSTGIRCADAYEDQMAGAGTAPVLHLEAVIPMATNPDPADGAADVNPSLAIFSWTPGEGAVTHNIYIGTGKDLTDADLVAKNYGAPAYFYSAGLKSGTTYYWRIDEVDASRNITSGTLWSFATAAVTATVPNPAEGAVWGRNDTTVSWKAGLGAVSHRVYGSTSKAAVAAGDPNALLGTQAGTSFTLGKLTPLSVYYWRIDEVDAQGTVVPGPVWTLLAVGANTGSWKTAAAAAQPGYLATYVADGLYDIGTFGGEQSYEFIVRGNPDEKEPSQCLIGRRDDVGATQVGLKYEQWENTGTYGATTFGVMDYDYGVANAPGQYTHLVFVSSKAANKTDLYVNGILKGSIATAIPLSGKVGIGYGAQNRPPAAPSFDNFDGNIFGVAIYDRALSAAEIAANSAAFLVGGPEAVTLDIKLAAATDDMEEYVATGAMSATSSDLEMPYEDSVTANKEQLVGLRYFLATPKDATVTKAYVQFNIDELTLGTQPVNLVIEGQLIANAPAFTSTAKDISNRTTRTQAKAKWSVENWVAPNGQTGHVSSLGLKSQTADLAPILQELVNQNGWASGNAVVLIFSDDKSNPSQGLRCADAYEDGANYGAVLHVEVLLPWVQ